MLSSTGAANRSLTKITAQGARSADIREIKISIAAPDYNSEKFEKIQKNRLNFPHFALFLQKKRLLSPRKQL